MVTDEQVKAFKRAWHDTYPTKEAQIRAAIQAANADAFEAQAKQLAYLGGTVEVLAVENEELRARIAVLEAALTKAATRLKEVHSKGRASRSQYKIYAEEAFAALTGEKAS